MSSLVFVRRVLVFTCLLALLASHVSAQERAYFSTYDHYLEEAGDLEIAVATTTGAPKHGHSVYTANFVLGAEAFGGLASSVETGLAETRHYLGPVMAWRLNERTTVKASPVFGLTEASDRYLVRFGIAYEFSTR